MIVWQIKVVPPPAEDAISLTTRLRSGGVAGALPVLLWTAAQGQARMALMMVRAGNERLVVA